MPCISGFNLTTRDSYLTILFVVFTSHILGEKTENKIMVLKPANMYQIIQYCHNFKNFQRHPFLYQAKLL